jgi:hypothetical protein
MPWGHFRGKPTFESELEAGARRAGWSLLKIEPDHAVIARGAEQRTLNLYNLRPGWESAHPSQRESLIDTFMRAMLGAEENLEVPTLEKARPRLMPRIGARMDPMEDPPARRELLPFALDINLVVDSEDSMAYVHESTLKRWGATFDSLLPGALANLRARTEPGAWEPMEDAPGLLVYRELDEYAAARVLILRDLVAPWPREGCVVGIPSRRWLLIVRLDSVQAVQAMNSLFQMTVSLHEREGWKVFPQPLWFDGQSWEMIPVTITRGQMDVRIGARLGQALNRLAEVR